jgi:hypothetical protein
MEILVFLGGGSQFGKSVVKRAANIPHRVE